MATKKTKMTDDHKAALASGREHARHVKAYLEALESHRPKRGRQVTKESRERRFAALTDEFVTASPMRRLSIAQTRRDIEASLAATDSTVDVDALAEGFVAHAKAYAESKSISYAAFRKVNVPADVLKSAGISR